MSKLLLMLIPIAVYILWLLICAIRKKLPSRRMMNMHTSLLLMIYLLITSGLGIFWVAEQQLPVFDWHYLFGYGTLLLVFIHLFFNLPPLVRTLKRKARPSKRTKPTQQAYSSLALVAALALGVVGGTQLGSSKIQINWTDTTPLNNGPIDAIIDYHKYSSELKYDGPSMPTSVNWGAEEREFKTYETNRIELLPALTDSRSVQESILTVNTPPKTLDLQAISTILHHTAGVTAVEGGYNLRAAPSSGALAPTEVYLAAMNIAGVPDGHYYYHPKEHSIYLVNESSPSKTRFFITSIFRRTGQKYEDRAYRYALADAGHMLENLRIVVGEFGYEGFLSPQFDEGKVAEDISIDGVTEGVVAVLELASSPYKPTAAKYKSPNKPEAFPIGVTGVVHRATSLEEIYEEGIPLPKAAITRPVLETIQNRRSRRRYSEVSMSMEQLGAILLSSVGSGRQLSNSIQIRFIADRIDDLQQGLYRYLPESHSIVLEREEDLIHEAYLTTFSQEAIGNGAVAFILSTDRKILFTEYGARDYRHAFIEAGMISERIILSAIGLDLYTCPVGAFYDDQAAELIASNMEEEWVLHFIGMGIP